MTNNSEKQRRKALLKSVKANELHELEAGMAMVKELVRDMFDYLDDALEESGCAHNLDLTLAFLHKHNQPIDKVVPWLNQHGGYCDCEVVANVEDKLERILRD